MPLVKKLPANFSKHFSGWVRLEPRCRSDDFARGLEARTADPLWMLARQWASRELAAEDAGSPYRIEVTSETQPLTGLTLGESGVVSPLPDQPLEPLVEHEQLELSWRDRVQVGQQFERLIRSTLKQGNPNPDDVVKTYREMFPLTLPEPEMWVELDRATRKFLWLAAGRVVDGKTLLSNIDFANDAQPNFPLGDGVTSETMKPILKGLKDWCTAVNIQPTAARAPAWRNAHLDYRFEVKSSAKGEAQGIHLVAPDYQNGALDWHTFNVVNGVQGQWSEQKLKPMAPRRVSIGGSSLRWWAFEDAATDFGNLDVAKPDIARLLLMEFVLIYGDDWFVVPLKVNMSNLLRVKDLFITNVFGETIPVPSARKPDPDPLLRFDLFTLSPLLDASQSYLGDPTAPGCGEFLVIPPIAAGREEGPVTEPLEEVRFLRDEGANMVWGLEHRVANGLGRAVDGFNAQRERIERRLEVQIARLEAKLRDIEGELQGKDPDDPERPSLEREGKAKQVELDRLREGTKPSNGETPRYRLATTVPENWIPFSPFSAQGSTGLDYRHIRLRRAKMLRNVDDEEPTDIPALSRLLDLNEDPLLWLEEATVSRAGLRVQLTGQRVRWVDGKTYVWRGRKVLTGRGEGSSGLRFDYLKD